MCLYPTLRLNKKYIANKKNGGVIPPIKDERVRYVPTGCGNCMECRKQYARNWQVRLLEDVRVNKNGIYVTFKFCNNSIKELTEAIKKKHPKLDGYELDNAIATLGVKRWRERWRKEHKYSPRHWLVTELGGNGTENIHLHGIVWTDKGINEIEKHWKYDKNFYKPERNWVNEQTVNYVVKYVNKVDAKHKEYKQKVLTSAGIGAHYIERADSKKNVYREKEETNQTYKTRTGHKIAMPTYWRNKIYTEEERERLWLEMLDKKERWVDGTKIDISKGDEHYYKALNEARRKNNRLGYGNDEKNWERKQYENERRKLKIKERIDKTK